MDRLSGFDTQEHPLETLLGTSYQATTLSQFLGQLERIEAGGGLAAADPAAGPRRQTGLRRWAHDRILESQSHAQGSNHHARTPHGGFASGDQP